MANIISDSIMIAHLLQTAMFICNLCPLGFIHSTGRIRGLGTERIWGLAPVPSWLWFRSWTECRIIRQDCRTSQKPQVGRQVVLLTRISMMSRCWCNLVVSICMMSGCSCQCPCLQNWGRGNKRLYFLLTTIQLILKLGVWLNLEMLDVLPIVMQG